MLRHIAQVLDGILGKTKLVAHLHSPCRFRRHMAQSSIGSWVTVFDGAVNRILVTVLDGSLNRILGHNREQGAGSHWQLHTTQAAGGDMPLSHPRARTNLTDHRFSDYPGTGYWNDDTYGSCL